MRTYAIPTFTGRSRTHSRRIVSIAIANIRAALWRVQQLCNQISARLRFAEPRRSLRAHALGEVFIETRRGVRRHDNACRGERRSYLRVLAAAVDSVVRSTRRHRRSAACALQQARDEPAGFERRQFVVDYSELAQHGRRIVEFAPALGGESVFGFKAHRLMLMCEPLSRLS